MLRKKSASLVRRDLIARYAIFALLGAGINIAAAAPVMAEAR